MGVGGQHHAPAAFTPGKTRYPCTGGWVASEPVWIGAENLAPTGIRSSDLPARSESLYRLSHPGSCSVDLNAEYLSEVNKTPCSNFLFVYLLLIYVIRL